MVARKLVLCFFLCLFGTTAHATTRAPRLGGPEFCNLQRLSATQPSQRQEFEGGSIETWDVNDDQFQCTGLVPMKKTIQPNSLSLPSYHPFPRIVYIEQGEGIIGVQLPGCVEKFDTGVGQQQGAGGGDMSTDSHEKVHRFSRGDIIAIPAGAVHWTYNDGNQDVVAISINDINNPANQLDMQPRTFYLAGGTISQGTQGQTHPTREQQQQGGSFDFLNIFAGFDTELLAEAFNSDPEIVRSMQEPGNRGLIVKVQEPMQLMITPDEEQQQRQGGGGGGGEAANGPEETIFALCSAKFLYNLDNQLEADVFNRQAGKLNAVIEYKLPILSYLDLSAEKGHLLPHALGALHWSTNSNNILYVLSGDAHIQIVSNKGEAVFDQQVKRGDIFFVPQFFAAVGEAGENGWEWVAFKTNKSPVKSQVTGYMSVFQAMPLQVITNSYHISSSQAQSLKSNRETETWLLSPQRTIQSQRS